MQQFDDISEMLSQGNFSEDLDPGLKKHKNLQPNPQKNHLKQQAQIPKSPRNLNQDIQGHTNRSQLDIKEFFPPDRDSSSEELEQNAEKQPTCRIGQHYQTVHEGQIVYENKLHTCKNYTKNLAGNITKTVTRIILKNYEPQLAKAFVKFGIKPKEFYKFFKKMQKKIKGPTSMVELFKIEGIKPEEMRMKALFTSAFTKIIRKRYLLHSLKKGKMQDLETYIRWKNTRLQYFPDEIPNAMKNSGI